MGVDIGKMPIGAAVFAIGDWVTNAGSTTLVDVGGLKAPPKLTDSDDHYELTSENAQGVLRLIPTMAKPTLEVVMQENDLVKLRRLLNQATAALSGTDPNRTLIRDPSVEIYLQGQIITKAIAGSGGTYGTRTMSFWRMACTSRQALEFAKGGEQAVGITFLILQDLSIAAAGNGQFYKIQDTLAS